MGRRSGKYSLFVCCGYLACLMFMLFFAGCAGQRQPVPVLEETAIVGEEKAIVGEEKAIGGGAAGALFADAEEARQSGKFDDSEMLLERALRIEPHNPQFWYTMALVKFQQEQYTQTVQLCHKAESLAAKNLQLLSQVKQLRELAEKAMTQQ